MDAFHPHRWIRILAPLGALVVAITAVLLERSDARDVETLVNRALELGVTGPALAEIRRDVRREADPAERRLALAHTLFRLSGQYREKSDERRVQRLLATEELAAASLAGLPASWEAASLLGASRFERRKLQRDTRLFTAAADWEIPLFASVARAAGSTVVERFLAAAYLEVWPAMSVQRRDQATQTLRRAFTDRRFYAGKFDDLIRVAGSIDRAAELLPTDFVTAARLARAALQGGQDEVAVRYRQVARRRQIAELGTTIDHALVREEPERSRLLTSVVEQASLGLDFAPVVERAMLERASRELGLDLAGAANQWLLWAEPLCLVTTCPFSPRAVDGLVAAAGAQLGSPESAFAALAAGKPVKASMIEQRANAAWSEGWIAYRLFSARLRLRASDLAGARARLTGVHAAATTRPVYAQLLREAGLGNLADPTRLARTSWTAAEWRGPDPASELELGAARRASAIQVGFRTSPKRTFMLEAELDGQVGVPLVVASRADQIVVPFEITPGIHLLRLRALDGRLPPLDGAFLAGVGL